MRWGGATGGGGGSGGGGGGGGGALGAAGATAGARPLGRRLWRAWPCRAWGCIGGSRAHGNLGVRRANAFRRGEHRPPRVRGQLRRPTAMVGLRAGSVMAAVVTVVNCATEKRARVRNHKLVMNWINFSHGTRSKMASEDVLSLSYTWRSTKREG